RRVSRCQLHGSNLHRRSPATMILTFPPTCLPVKWGTSHSGTHSATSLSCTFARPATSRCDGLVSQHDVEWICGGGMAKSADALDLKSNGPQGPCGFNSHSRYQ